MKDIDRLFGDILENHATPPSTGAWERVESNLRQPNQSMSWMRWAAVLVPALVAAGLWMNASHDTPPQIVTQVNTPALQPEELTQQQVVAEAQPVAPRTTPKKQAPKAVAPVAQPTAQLAVEETLAFEDLTLEPVTLEEEVAVIVETPKPLVLVYTLETVTTETPDGADRNALDRMVDFARTVKHSDPIADIRSLKDELFALDLRKKQPKKN